MTRNLRRLLRRIRWEDSVFYGGLSIVFVLLLALLLFASIGVAIDLITPPVYETKTGIVAAHRVSTVVIENVPYVSYYVTVNGKQYEVSQGDYKRISVGSWLKFKVRVNGVFSHKIIVEAVE